MIPKSTLDIITRKTLEELLNKSPGDLTPNEIAFLHARSAYLNDNELEAIPDIQEVEVIGGGDFLASTREEKIINPDNTPDPLIDPKRKAKRKYLN